MSSLARTFRWGLLARLSREGRLLVALACLSLGFGAAPSRGQSHVLVFATLSLLASAVLFARFYRLEAVRAELSLPRRVSAGDEFTFSVRVQNDAERDYGRLRIDLPRLGRAGTFTRRPREIAGVQAGRAESASGRARFRERGLYRIQPFRVARLLPLGLSQGAPVLTASARLLVAPKPARIGRLRLFDEVQRREGGTRSLRRGEDRVLAGVRPYRAGDPPRQLHARSWARHGEPMVREYHTEEATALAVFADVDASAGAERLEAALSLCAGIVERISEGENRLLALACGSDVSALGGERGAGAFHAVLEKLALARPESFRHEAVMARLGPLLDGAALVILVLTRWEEDRARFVLDLRTRGVEAQIFTLGFAAPPGVQATEVPLEAISSGRELAL